MSSKNNDKITDIVIPTLQNIQAELAGLKSDAGELKRDMGVMKESIRRIDARIAYMDSYLAGIHSQLRWQNDEMDDLRGRIEALEDNPLDKSPE
jgi:chromosome segregation ATPase